MIWLTAPVIHEHHAKDVVRTLVDCDGRAKRVALAHDKGLEDVNWRLKSTIMYHFKFKVQLLRRPKKGQAFFWLDLATGSDKISMTDNNGRGAAVVANGHVDPVWIQCILCSS